MTHLLQVAATGASSGRARLVFFCSIGAAAAGGRWLRRECRVPGDACWSISARAHPHMVWGVGWHCTLSRLMYSYFQLLTRVALGVLLFVHPLFVILAVGR
jgi:hypothetical protein